MGAGDVTHDTPSTTVVGNAALSGPVDLPTDALKVGENVLAVEVHQGSSGSSDIVMAAELILDGGTQPALTPGTANNVAVSLPPFPTLRINEVLPINSSGIQDASGKNEPWIELFNDGASPVDVSGLFLSDDPLKLDKWIFPSARVIQPGGFLVVFADNEPAQNTPAEFHTNFRLPQTPGTAFKLVLSRTQLKAVAAIDEFSLIVPAADSSFTRFPDGDTATGVVSAITTPGAANDLVGINHKPILGSITPPAAFAGVPWSVKVSALDSDTPAQKLKYSLPIAPLGALIGETDGVIQWMPNTTNPGQQRFVVRVVDSGTPPLSDEREFFIQVRAPLNLRITVGLPGKSFMAEWDSVLGQGYRLEYCDDVDSGVWSLHTTYSGNGTVIRAEVPIDSATRFFRIVQP
jgi:hypothetical protein